MRDDSGGRRRRAFRSLAGNRALLRARRWPPSAAPPPAGCCGDFRWVTPTRDNLGALRVPIPSGFTQARTGGLPVPGINL